MVNNCPLCRKIICEKPNNIKNKLSNTDIRMLITNQFTTNYTERNDLDLYNYIIGEIEKFDTLNKIKLNDQINIDIMKKEVYKNIIKEVIESAVDVCEDMNNYYSS